MPGNGHCFVTQDGELNSGAFDCDTFASKSCWRVSASLSRVHWDLVCSIRNCQCRSFIVLLLRSSMDGSACKRQRHYEFIILVSKISNLT